MQLLSSVTKLVLIKNELEPTQQQQLDKIKETNPEYARVFELNLGSSDDGTKVTIRSQPESTLAEQEKATYYLVGKGIKHPIEFKNLNDIDPGDIESISVFKGESAIKNMVSKAKTALSK